MYSSLYRPSQIAMSWKILVGPSWRWLMISLYSVLRWFFRLFCIQILLHLWFFTLFISLLITWTNRNRINLFTSFHQPLTTISTIFTNFRNFIANVPKYELYSDKKIFQNSEIIWEQYFRCGQEIYFCFLSNVWVLIFTKQTLTII